MKKPDFTVLALRRFFNALGIANSDPLTWSWGPYDTRFDVACGNKPEWCRWGTRSGPVADFMADLSRLRQINRSAAHGGRDCSVFMQMPSGMLYIDDMTASGVAMLRARGVTPRAVIETSPGSHQVHLHVPSDLSPLEVYLGVQLEYGADPSAHPASSGLQGRLARLPGFINTKPSRAGAWVKCRSATSSKHDDAQPALRELAAIGRAQIHITAAPIGAGAGDARGDRLRRPQTTTSPGNSDNSPSAEDMRRAIWMAARGYEEARIVEEIAQRRASRGHSLREAHRNARYTVRKAMDWVQRR